MTLDNSQKIPITCPQCGTENQKTVGWFKANDGFPCVQCGTRIDTQDLRRGLQDAEDSIEGLARTIKGINKKL